MQTCATTHNGSVVIPKLCLEKIEVLQCCNIRDKKVILIKDKLVYCIA
jgi:hypothetical protein